MRAAGPDAQAGAAANAAVVGGAARHGTFHGCVVEDFWPPTLTEPRRDRLGDPLASDLRRAGTAVKEHGIGSARRFDDDLFMAAAACVGKAARCLVIAASAA
ncbi:MAG: hypothetical protein DMG89_20150 [Acidobacteria bacterium]|nr:MAG: hypothetical protein DMG89_20150 [Acidobacteriota bacterium]